MGLQQIIYKFIQSRAQQWQNETKLKNIQT